MVWGPVVWVPKIPLWKGLLLRGTKFTSWTRIFKKNGWFPASVATSIQLRCGFSLLNYGTCWSSGQPTCLFISTTLWWPLFWLKFGPSFGGLKAQNRGQSQVPGLFISICTSSLVNHHPTQLKPWKINNRLRGRVFHPTLIKICSTYIISQKHRNKNSKICQGKYQPAIGLCQEQPAWWSITNHHCASQNWPRLRGNVS